MKKVSVDYKYITSDIIKEIATAYPKGFIDSDIITFTEINNELQDRVKVELDGVLYLISKEVLEDNLSDKFDDDYFSSLNQGDEWCDAESDE